MRIINGVDVLDTMSEILDPAHTALICVDVQNDFCAAGGHFDRHGKSLSMISERLGKMVSFVRGAQGAGIPVAFIQQESLPNNQSDSPAWLRFKTRDGKAPDYTLVGSWGWELVEGLEPGPRDWTVGKFRPDAFHGTHLDLVLQAVGIKSVVVLGTITEGCVESTIRSASYHDYYVVVAEDAVASPNAELHEGSIRLFNARYPCMSSDEIMKVWGLRAGRLPVTGPRR